MLESGELSEGHGRAVLQAQDHHTRRRVAREARDRSLSVRQTEALARGAGEPRSARRRKPRLQSADAIAAARATEEELTAALGAEVRVRLGRRGGTVEIPFDDLSEVHEMTRRITGKDAP
jgi:ParB family chromosome partitioning protein